jgi:hypothetical protein
MENKSRGKNPKPATQTLNPQFSGSFNGSPAGCVFLLPNSLIALPAAAPHRSGSIMA